VGRERRGRQASRITIEDVVIKMRSWNGHIGKRIMGHWLSLGIILEALEMLLYHFLSVNVQMRVKADRAQ
jgi:hypothetical protein